MSQSVTNAQNPIHRNASAVPDGDPLEHHMKFENLLSEIREANLSYLMLARQMISEDKAEATFRLGIDTDLADLLASLSSAQLLKIASSNMVMCRFRFDDRTLWNLITSHSKDRETGMGSVHAAILLGSRELETA
jgi:flagellar transcriptional activator FlhD